MAKFLPNLVQQVRPRLLCELRASGVVAARADAVTGLLAQVTQGAFAEGAVHASVRGVNFMERGAVVKALQQALDRVKGGSRDMTLIVPDAAARVMLLDFDSLPAKMSDAIPIVRFRLSKLLPFSSETCALSYQVLSQRSGAVQVLAVAMPREVLDEYESAARDAGFEPGSVLPSTLAAMGSLSVTEPVLLMNLDSTAVTTAIVRRGELLLHRTLELEPLQPVAAESDSEGGVVVMHTVSIEVEVQQALSVAAAYYEDIVGVAPREVYVCGSGDAHVVQQVADDLQLAVRDVVNAVDVPAGASGVALPLLAGVRGAAG